MNITKEVNIIKNASKLHLKYKEERIKLIKKEEELPNPEISSHDVHHYTSIYVVVQCIIIMAVYQVIYRKRNRPVSAIRTLRAIILDEESIQGIELREFNAKEYV